MKKLSWKSWLLLALLAVGTVWVVRHDGATWHSNQGRVFGTVYHVTYLHSTDLQSAIEGRMAEVDRSLSMFNPQSTISRINDGSSTATDSLFRHVFRLAAEVNSLTNGAFDITVAPLVNAWGFGFRHDERVTPEAIDSLRRFVGMARVHLTADGRLLKDDPRTMLDCSAIAKGFGADHVASLFDSLGIRNYMVEIGGEVVVRGHNSKGNDWRIGINSPEEDALATTNALDTIVSLTGCAMATSGNYRNYYVRDGRRYAHTIDPRLGTPVQHSVLSATVIAPTCMEADALATSFMVLGADSARLILASRPDLRAYLILSPDSATHTPRVVRHNM